MFLQSSVEDFTFKYPHAMVHTCLFPKNCPKITQPLIINLKTDINYETCNSRVTFEYTYVRIIKCLNLKNVQNSRNLYFQILKYI